MHARSCVRSIYAAHGGRTSLARIFEAGSLRLRHPRGGGCEAVLVNTAGGVVGGDHLDLDVALEPGADLTLTSAAAEKIYRSEGPLTRIASRLTLAPTSRAVFVPQETILFEGVRVHRSLEVDLADGATLATADILVFGRTECGARAMSGSFRDSVRLRRAGRLVFADETRLEGAIGAALARPAVGRGATALALILLAESGAAARLDAVRAAIDDADAVEGGASLKDGIIIARLLANSSERLRWAVAHVLAVGGAINVPRTWN